MLNCPSCEHYDQANSYCNLFRHAVNLGCQSGTERKPRNNYERIKAMSMEEMADWLNKGFVCPPKHGCPKNEASCEKCWLEWLKEEITDA